MMQRAHFDVLLVDDNASLLSLLAEFLGGLGYSVLCAPNGREALRVLGRSTVRLVITDIFMPETDGFELIMDLRKTLPALGVIAMSGDGKVDPELYLKTARQFGVRQALTKPFPLTEFISAVRAVIGEASSAHCAA